MATLKSSTFKDINISTTYEDTTDHRVDLTLQNSWVDYDTTYWGPAHVVKIGNVIYVMGLIKNGTITGNTVVTTLPPGYRPAGSLIFPCYYNSSSAECRIDVNSSGHVYINGVTSNTYVTLNTIVFCV